MNAVEVHVHNVTVNETLSKILSIMELEKEIIIGKKKKGAKKQNRLPSTGELLMLWGKKLQRKVT